MSQTPVDSEGRYPINSTYKLYFLPEMFQVPLIADIAIYKSFYKNVLVKFLNNKMYKKDGKRCKKLLFLLNLQICKKDNINYCSLCDLNNI